MSDRRDLVVWTPTVEYGFHLEPGTSLLQAYDALPAHFKETNLVAYKAGVEIPREDWAGHYLYPSDRVIFAVMPAGGGGKKKGIIGIIAGIALIVGGFISGQVWMMQIGAGLLLSGIGSMLIKPPALNSNMGESSERDSSYYSITGQSNQATPYKPVPKLYGRHKMFPVIASQPLIHNAGTQSYISCLYDFGTGMVDIQDIRIGDTAAGVFGPAFVFHYNELNPQMVYATSKISVDQFSYTLQLNAPLELQTSSTAYYAELDIAFTKGLAFYNDQGNPTLTSVAFQVAWRAVNGGGWHYVGPESVMGMSAINLSGQYSGSGAVNFVDPNGYIRTGTRGRDHDPYTDYYWRGQYFPTSHPPDGTYGYTGITLSKGAYSSALAGYELVVNANSTSTPGNVTGFQVQDASTRPTVACVGFNFPTPGAYIVHITRLTPISTSTRRSDEAVITQLKSFMAGNVLNLQTPHTMLEMRLLASEKVTGVVQNLSAICTSVLPIYNQYGTYLGHFATRNPAWICLDILLGDSNPRPLPWSMIDWPSWVALANYCDTWRTWNVNGQVVSGPRFTCDVVIDYQSTIKELIGSILSSCHAGLIVTATGQWGVLIDERDYFVARQLITPANSWSFSGTRTFAEQTHAFKVSFVDSTHDYQKQEVMCYRDGYSAANATKFEELGTFGVTDFVHAWAFGRFMFAQAIDRSETLTVTMDIEHLAVQRGDGILLQHDVPRIGGRVARIAKVEGDTVTMPIELGDIPTGYVLRQQDGQCRSGRVLGIVDENTVRLDTTAKTAPDDLIVLGVLDKITAPYIVLAVTPGEDFTAVLDLVPYVDAMYDSDIGLIPPWNPNFGYDVETQVALVITTLNLTTETYYLNRIPVERVTLTFTVDKPPLYARAELFIKVPGYTERKVSETKGYAFTYTFDLVQSPEVVAKNVVFEVVAYTSANYPGVPKTIALTIVPDRTPPAPVKGFAANIIGDMIEIFWQLQDEPDTISHELRYSPDVINGRWEASQQLGVFDWWVMKTSVGARTGKYFLQSKDTSGNVSTVVWQRTTVEHLPHIDLVMEIDEPGFPGDLYDLERNGSKVQSAGAYGAVAPQGYYYYDEFVDLGSVYEVRVSNKSTAHGSSAYDLMANWQPLAQAQPLAKTYNGLWNAILEYRTSNTAATMAVWLPNLAAIDPIAGTAEDLWSPWRAILVGDITARFIQFRHNVQSFDSNVKGVLDDGLIVIDVAETTWTADDVPVLTPSTHFTFNPPFQQVPTIAVSINGGTATRYTVLAKDRSGVTLQLLNVDAPVSGTVDISAIGYGKERLLSI